MALYKITDEQVQNSGVISAPDKLTGTAAQNKAIFDKLVREVVKVQLNNLVDALMAYTGADEIGAQVEGLEGDTIQKVMESLKAKQDEETEALEAAKNELQGNIDELATKEQEDYDALTEAGLQLQNEINALAEKEAEDYAAVGTRIDEEVVELQTMLQRRYTKVQVDEMFTAAAEEVAAEISPLVESVSFADGVLTVTKKDGTQSSMTIDTECFIQNVASTDTIGMSVGNGGVVAAYVKDGSIGASKLQGGSVTSAKLANNSVGTSKLTSGAVTMEKLSAEVQEAIAAGGEGGGGDADKVKFNNDLTTTFEIGNIKLENGQAVIPAAGKTLTEVWNKIFVAEKNPTVTAPKVTLTAPECKAYEVGQKVTPTYTATLSAGQYEFGPATGITATSWDVTNTKTAANTDTVVGKLSTAAGTFGEVTVEDGTTYVITAEATHGAGAVPVTNLGNAYAAGAIAAGTKKATSAAISGYRNGFYGTANSKDATVNSAFVRSLQKKSGKKPAAGNVWELPVPVGAMRIVFAYPATLRDVSSVTDVNGMNAEIKTAFTKQTVAVEGSNGYTAIDYKVYVLDRAEPVTEANTFKITI